MMQRFSLRFAVLWAVGLILCLLVEGLSVQAEVYRGSVAPRPDAAAKQSLESAPSVVKKIQVMSSASAESAAKKSAPATSSSKKITAKSKKARNSKTAKAPAKKTGTTSKAEAQAKKTSSTAGKQTAPKKNGTKAAQQSAPKKSPSKAEIGAKDLRLNVKSALLINMSTGKVYFEQNPDKAIAPASITKLLTLFLIRESMTKGKISAKTPIPISSTAVRTGGSSMSLRRGEKVPLGELIKGISVVSANNACVAVAEYLGQGDPGRFVKQMNAKALALGMTKSRFRNPSGLPAPDQLSTARDLAKLSMAYLRTFPESLSVHSMTTHTYGGETHRNANSLLRTYKGVDGLKTGFVCASGYNITATAKRGKTRFLAVVLGANSPVIRQVETSRLLDYGFKRVAAEQNQVASARK